MHPNPTDPPLAAALIESRARWRDLALLAADLLFETDAAGRFTFVAPDPVLGAPAESLIGAEARSILTGGADPFGGVPARGARAWVRAGDATLCLEFTVMSHAGGLRGAARDVTAEERGGEATARALRRSAALGRLLGAAARGRGDGQAEAALRATLYGLLPALGCAGAALWEGDAALLTLGDINAQEAGRVCIGGGLSLRVARAAPLDEDERALLASLAPAVAALQAEAARQRDLDAAAHTDALTGLLNRRGFGDLLAKQLRRGRSGTVAYLDLDGLKPLNDGFGHAAGDAALRAMAARLRGAVRAGDLVARLGGDEFALWLEGADAAAATARCARLGDAGPLSAWPEAGPRALRASLGVAEAVPGDDAEALLARADAAMYLVKHGAKHGRRAA